MLVRKAYKFKLKTNTEIESKLQQFAGCCRLVWNKVYFLNKKRLENKHKIMWSNEAEYWLTFWKKTEELKFLKDCHSQVLQQKIQDLDKAFKDCFNKSQVLKKFPRAKKKGINDSFRYVQGFKITNKRIYLPKIGWVSFFKSCDIKGLIKNVTISSKASKWYASVQVEQEVPERVHPSNKEVGIDMGVAQVVTLSNGEQFRPINSVKEFRSKLTKAQRKLSKRQKFSNNWRKTQKKIQQIHTKIANIRKDTLHKISNVISKNHAIIYIEDLKVSNMTKSAKGTMEQPGKNVKAKSGLNKAILEQSWHELRRQLEYKSNWLGGKVIAINPKYTSQKCSVCATISKANRTSQTNFECIVCGFKENADINAAKNILAAGQAVLACGEVAT